MIKIKKLKQFRYDSYDFKNMKKTRSMKRRSGGYSYIYEGNAYWKDTGTFAGSVRVSCKNLDDFKGRVKTGLVHFNKRRKN